MRESEKQVEKIKRNLHRVDRLVFEKKLGNKMTKVKSAFNLAGTHHLINELKSRK